MNVPRLTGMSTVAMYDSTKFTRRFSLSSPRCAAIEVWPMSSPALYAVVPFSEKE